MSTSTAGLVLTTYVLTGGIVGALTARLSLLRCRLGLVKLMLWRGAVPDLFTLSPSNRAVKDDRRGTIPTLLEYGVGPQDSVMLRSISLILGTSESGYLILLPLS